MRRMVIISPDPENARMLGLAFELHGWEVGLAADLQQLRRLPRHEDAELTLIDLIDAEAARQPGLKRGLLPGRLLVIAPHGMSEEEAKRRYGLADRIVRRPFELLSLVKLAEAPSAPPSQPPRTRPGWKRPARTKVKAKVKAEVKVKKKVQKKGAAQKKAARAKKASKRAPKKKR